MMWLSVYFPALLVPMDNPDPVVVYHSAHNRVMQCNDTALAAGIEVNMGLGSASALCAQLCIVPYSEEQERLLLTQLMYKLYQFNSDICVEQSNELLIRCDRHDYYYGSPDVHLRVLIKQLTTSGQPFHFATAHTPEQASVLARAKVDRVLAENKVLPTLYTLPIHQLNIEEKTQQQLQRVGVRSIKALLDLPMAELAGRFPQSVIKYIYALKGSRKTTRVFYHPKDTFCETVELPFDMSSTDHLQRWATSLLNLLQTYLRNRNCVTQALTLLLIDSEKGTHPLILRSGEAKCLTEQWLPVLTLTLEKTVLPHPIRTMQLRCDHTLPASPDANDLFLGKRSRTVEAHKLFDALQARLGEHAFHPPNSEHHQFAKQWPTPAATPAFMLPEAQPLTIPSHVIAGPQRLQTHWWHTPLKRDYFLLETQQHERLWAYRSDQQRWFFQGWFS